MTRLRTLLPLTLLLLAATAAAAWGSHSRLAPKRPPANATVTVGTSGPGTRLHAGFIGLGVVADTLAQGQFDHTNLADYLRLLGPHGTVRIGGNRVDSFWTSSGEPAPAWSKGEVTPADLRGLARSLRGTGWRVILGVPILHPDPSRSADEARYAERILGPLLEGIEIGNEPNLFGISESSYFKRFERAARAITAAAPGVSIVGPGMGREAPTGRGRLAEAWLKTFTRDEAPHPDIALLTTHEYPLSVCNGRHPTIAQLLSAGSERHEVAAADSASAAARALGVPAAIDETNSAICWGAPGVSNTYASALWILDYGLLIAQHGVSAADFQTRLSGCKPYLPLCTAAHGTRLFARPELYGLLALRQMGTGTFLSAGVSPSSSRLRVYAVKNGPGSLSIALDNLGPALTVSVRVPGQRLIGGMETVLRTSSPKGLSGTTGITLGGRRVGANARLGSLVYSRLEMAGQVVHINLAAHTAAVVKLS